MTLAQSELQDERLSVCNQMTELAGKQMNCFHLEQALDTFRSMVELCDSDESSNTFNIGLVTLLMGDDAEAEKIMDNVIIKYQENGENRAVKIYQELKVELFNKWGNISRNEINTLKEQVAEKYNYCDAADEKESNDLDQNVKKHNKLSCEVASSDVSAEILCHNTGVMDDERHISKLLEVCEDHLVFQNMAENYTMIDQQKSIKYYELAIQHLRNKGSLGSKQSALQEKKLYSIIGMLRDKNSVINSEYTKNEFLKFKTKVCT